MARLNLDRRDPMKIGLLHKWIVLRSTGPYHPAKC